MTLSAFALLGAVLMLGGALLALIPAARRAALWIFGSGLLLLVSGGLLVVLAVHSMD